MFRRVRAVAVHGLEMITAQTNLHVKSSSHNEPTVPSTTELLSGLLLPYVYGDLFNPRCFTSNSSALGGAEVLSRKTKELSNGNIRHKVFSQTTEREEDSWQFYDGMKWGWGVGEHCCTSRPSCLILDSIRHPRRHSSSDMFTVYTSRTFRFRERTDVCP